MSAICQGLGRAVRLASAWAFGVMLPAFAGAEPVYTFGVVPQFEYRTLIAIWKPIVDEISRRTGVEVQLSLQRTYPEFEAALDRGQFDFVYANPYQTLRLGDNQGYGPLVRDREPLRGILVVRKDSPITDIKALDGKVLAVPSLNAFGASLLLRAELDRLYGIRPRQMEAKTHRSAYLHVIQGLADAAGGVQKTLAEQPQEVRDRLRILYTTQDLPPHAVSAHPRVPPAVRDRIRSAFLDMGATPAGKAMLGEIPMLQPVEASLGDYAAIRLWKLERYWLDEAR